MARHRTHSIAFKKQVAQEYLAGESLHGLARRHDVSRNLIRIWVTKYEAGEYDEDVEAADRLQEYEARIAALAPILTGSSRVSDQCSTFFRVARVRLWLTPDILRVKPQGPLYHRKQTSTPKNRVRCQLAGDQRTRRAG